MKYSKNPPPGNHGDRPHRPPPGNHGDQPHRSRPSPDNRESSDLEINCPVCDENIETMVNFCQSCGAELVGINEIKAAIDNKVSSDSELLGLQKLIYERTEELYSETLDEWRRDILEEHASRLESELKRVNEKRPSKNKEKFSSFDNPYESKTRYYRED